MRFGTWNTRNLGVYRTEALKTVTRKIKSYRLDLIEAQEIRREGKGSIQTGIDLLLTRK